MATEAKFGLKASARDSYLQLVQVFPLSSIRSEGQFSAAQRVIDRLLAQRQLDDGETTYLDALSDLVGVYEDAHHTIEPASDAEMLRHLLEAKGISPAQLSREAGVAKSTVSEILGGKKPFSRQMIRKLAQYFNVDVGVLAGNL